MLYVILFSCLSSCYLLQLWNTDTGETIRTYQFGNHDNGGLVILCINVSPDDQLLAATTTSGSGHQNLAVVSKLTIFGMLNGYF